jgi:L-ascorbate metabolism protein UlaG (beta-lactamase superfamily)
MSLPRSDHFNGKTFFNPRHENRTWLDVLRWRRTSRPTPWPRHVELAPQPPPPAPRGDEWVVTWIEHATFLVQTPAGNFLTDPNFSQRCGPLGISGPTRVHPPALALDALPRIDFLLLSHDHYDHCDIPTLRALARRHSFRAITPLANGGLLRRAGVPRDRIVELDWWQTCSPAPGVAITLTPSRHWSNRLSGRRNARLWGGFFVRHDSSGSAGVPPARSPDAGVPPADSPDAGGDACAMASRAWWFASDTGYDPELFHAIRARLGPPALAMIPIGAYEPRWFMAAQHCNPAEAVQIHRDVGAAESIAMHWGTWPLSDEGRDDPPRALAAARAAAGVSPEEFRVLAPGETIVRCR